MSKLTAPSPGRIVEIAFKHAESGDVVRRPAVVVRTWGTPDKPSALVNVKVFLDDKNDWYLTNPMTGQILAADSTKDPLWLTSVEYDSDGAVGKWRYCPQQSATIEV